MECYTNCQNQGNQNIDLATALDMQMVLFL